MKVKERQLWQWLKKGIPKGGHVQRVENSAGIGTLDVEGCIKGVSFWVELKAVATEAELDKAVSPAQRLFALRRRKAGGRAFFLAQIGTERYLYDPYFFGKTYYRVRLQSAQQAWKWIIDSVYCKQF